MDNGDSIFSTDNRNGCSEFSAADIRGPPSGDTPDIEFIYKDSDSYDCEIAELYSYTEGPEFQFNLKAFEDICNRLNVIPLWQSLNVQEKRSLIYRISDFFDLGKKSDRILAARAILYICQGCWGEVQSDQEQTTWVYNNIYLLFHCGIWHYTIKLFFMEIEAHESSYIPEKITISANITHSTDLRIILAILYTMIETLRHVKENEDLSITNLRESLREELSQPQLDSEELLAMTLMRMVTKFCNYSVPQFPMRKVLLFLWKILLFTLGGTDELKNIKDMYRKMANLDCNWEDTIDTTRTMRASSPPASATDLIEQQNNQRRRPLRRSLMKQSSLDDSYGVIDLSPYDECRTDIGVRPDNDEQVEMAKFSPSRPATPTPSQPESAKGLPWSPKVRQKDIDIFLHATRMKFVGFPLEGDRTTMAGLPEPIYEGMNILSKHIYVSLAEVQIKKEDEITKHPLSRPEGNVSQTPTEVLYQEMLPTLPQCMIALLKILLAASPTAKSKTDSINIMADVLPEEIPVSVVQSMKLGLDANRHKEILVKAVSCILLLLLKHFKLNHVYQFEFMSQHLVFANCIPLILKFFNQNLIGYVQAKNSIALLDFPACVIGDPPEMTTETLEATNGDVAFGEVVNPSNEGGSPNSSLMDETTTSFCCYRNMLSCINLLRILNKLCKWKHSRIMMLVVFKSASILRRTLKVRHAMMQLYVLKLLKIQTKYLGRQWRKTNMKIVSAIYQKVRHRINDDWAYGHDPDARPWDFQADECALRACVDRFNNRRYCPRASRVDTEYDPVDNCITSVLGRPVELTEEFKNNYEIWLEQEVLSTNIDWDQLITINV